MNDTSPEVEKIVTDRMKRLSGEERLKMGASMFDTAKQLVIASLSTTDETDMRIRIFLRFYGNDFDPVAIQKIVDYLIRARKDESKQSRQGKNI